jgi:beta-glucanase (GH16 family)
MYHSVTSADLGGNPWVFDRDFYLLINVAVGGTASVPPDESVSFPQTMLIDFIRVYAGEGAGLLRSGLFGVACDLWGLRGTTG